MHNINLNKILSGILALILPVSFFIFAGFITMCDAAYAPNTFYCEIFNYISHDMAVYLYLTILLLVFGYLTIKPGRLN